MKKEVKIIFVILILMAVCVWLIIENKDKSIDISKNAKLIYETSISPNEDFVEKEEDKVFLTIKIYQDKDNIIVDANSNSELTGNFRYKVETDKELKQDDINVEWQTIMGDTKFTKDNQLTVAIITLSKNGEIFSQRKINFASKTMDIIVDTINKN